jgi:predicted Mrr-cat superfamily restriction endonuclease
MMSDAKLDRPTGAFVLRQSPSGISRLESISLRENVIVNGWSAAPRLIEEKDYWKFREILRATHYSNEKNLRKAGYAAATMWRFINEMKIGDWVVVPHWGGVFYLAAITGDAVYDESVAAKETDSCYRRPVRWLNEKRPINRRFGKSKLISRMKTQGTSADAGDLLDEIYEALQLAMQQHQTQSPFDYERLFSDQLRVRMVETVLHEIRQGHIDERTFEQLVQKVLLANGAISAEIVPRLHDKGVDIIGEFLVGGVAPLKTGVQVKHHEGVTNNHWIDQLLKGMEEEDLSFGWFVTSAQYEPNAQEYLEGKAAGKGMQVFLVDGEQLASMIVEAGLANFAAKK